MIHLYTGVPGSGKSIHIAAVCKYAFKHGYPILSNFQLNTEKYPKANLTVYDNDVLTPRLIEEWAIDYWANTDRPFKEDSITVVLDEVGLLFSNRAWNSPDRKDWIRLASLHRKYGIRMIWAVQQKQMIDKQLLGMCEMIWTHRKLSNMGSLGFWLYVLSGCRPLFCAAARWNGTVRGKPLETKWYMGRKSLYELYDTRQIFARELLPGKSATGV